MGCKFKGPCVVDARLPKGDVEKNPYCRFAMKYEGLKDLGCPYWKEEKKWWKWWI